MVLREKRNPVDGVDAGFRGMKRVLVDVGGVEDGAFFQTFLAKQNDQRIEFFALAAACDPDLEGRVGLQVRHHLFADGTEVARIPEHLADLHCEIAQKMRQHGRLVQDLFLHRREGGEPHLLARLPEPALDRSHRVVAEIIVVANEQGLQQQPDFDVLDLCGRAGFRHFGIHTRTRDRSFSTSSGFAM